MPFQLDQIDVSIINSLQKDGRKSFRQIAREVGATTPTVKARFERLVNIGFLKSVSPVFDFEKIDSEINPKVVTQDVPRIRRLDQAGIRKGAAIKIRCDFCKGTVAGKLHVLRFVDQERYFCCTACRSGYAEKYRGRIEALKKRHSG